MYENASKNLKNSIVDVNSIKDLKKVIDSGKIARAYWCGSINSENEIKKKTGAKSLNSIINANLKNKICFISGSEAKYHTYFGKSH